MMVSVAEIISAMSCLPFSSKSVSNANWKFGFAVDSMRQTQEHGMPVASACEAISAIGGKSECNLLTVNGCWIYLVVNNYIHFTNNYKTV